VPLGQAKLGNLDGDVFLPDAGIEEDSGDVFELVACTLTEVVCEAEAGDQLAGLCRAQLRVLVRRRVTVMLMLIAFLHWVWGGSYRPGTWRAQGSGRATLQGSGGRRVFEGVAARLGGRKVCSAALAASGAA
jgi:hypothetical protein